MLGLISKLRLVKHLGEDYQHFSFEEIRKTLNGYRLLQMRRIVPGLILILLMVLTIHSLFSDQSYAKLTSLDKSLELQQAKNAELNTEVVELKKRLVGLTTNDRVLEKTARNELGMARDDELIFIFEKNKELNE